jgi:hypothetical protein
LRQSKLCSSRGYFWQALCRPWGKWICSLILSILQCFNSRLMYGLVELYSTRCCVEPYRNSLHKLHS